MKRGFFAVALVAILLLASCQQANKWVIEGEVAGVEGDTLFVKHLVNNQQEVIDQKILKKNGQFSFKLDKQQFEEFYFLQVNNGSQLVIVRDTLDVVTLKASDGQIANADIIGSNVSIAIQKHSAEIKALRKIFHQYQYAVDGEKEALAEVFREKYIFVKEAIGLEIYKDTKSLFCYYALFQRIDDENLLFSPWVQEDYKYFAAVATSYDFFRKDDPRTKALHDMVMNVLDAKRKARLNELVANAPEGIPDIIKKDVKGKERKLSDLKGKVVVLNFWMSQSKDARAFNEALKPIYKKYQGRGLEVFQVASDQSKLLWEDAIQQAKLPWINVCDCTKEMDRDFLTYNVQKVPTTFLIGKDGLMINRFTSIEELEKAIKKAL